MKKETRKMTICFLVRSRDSCLEVCLGKKKRGFRVGKLNGSGGKIEDNETPMQCAIRETEEEFGVKVKNIVGAGEVIYENFDRIYHCYIFISKKWQGTPIETEEMIPNWFFASKLPYKRMGNTDHYWIPEVLTGKCVNALFRFNKQGKLIHKKVEITS